MNIPKYWEKKEVTFDIDGREIFCNIWGHSDGNPEAAQRMIDYGFETLKLARIDADCRVVNEASRRVLRKCGFPFCGPGMLQTLASGRVASEHYAMDRRCWEAIRAWGRP